MHSLRSQLIIINAASGEGFCQDRIYLMQDGEIAELLTSMHWDIRLIQQASYYCIPRCKTRDPYRIALFSIRAPNQILEASSFKCHYEVLDEQCCVFFVCGVGCWSIDTSSLRPLAELCPGCFSHSSPLVLLACLGGTLNSTRHSIMQLRSFESWSETPATQCTGATEFVCLLKCIHYAVKMRSSSKVGWIWSGV